MSNKLNNGRSFVIDDNHKNTIRLIMTMAIPIALQSIISIGINMVDILIVGSIGEIELNAVSLAGQIMVILMLVLFGITGGANVIIAQYWGKGDTESIRIIIGYTFRTMFFVVAFISLIAFVFPQTIMSILTNNVDIIERGSSYLRIVSISYVFFGITTVIGNTLRSMGVVNISLFASLISICSSLFLNWVLVFGNLGFQRYGVLGSAMANIIARLLEFLILTRYLFFIDKKIKFRLSYIFKPEKKLKHAFKANSIPVVANELIWVLGSTVLAIIAGHMKIQFTSAYNIFNIVAQVSCTLAQGVGIATAVIVGSLIGKGKLDLLDSTIKVVQKLGLLSGIIGSIFILIIIPFAKLLNISSESYTIFIQIMIIGAAIEILRGLSFVNNIGILRGGGDVKFVFFNDVFFLWVICIPIGYMCQLGEGIPLAIVFFILRCDDMIKAIVANYRIKNYQWIHDTTSEQAS